MRNKERTFKSRFRQTLLLNTGLCLVTLSYIGFSLVLRAFGDNTYMATDLFMFCALMFGFSVAFFGLAYVVRAIVLPRLKD
jgi:hypothetical protein